MYHKAVSEAKPRTRYKVCSKLTIKTPCSSVGKNPIGVTVTEFIDLQKLQTLQKVEYF